MPDELVNNRVIVGLTVNRCLLGEFLHHWLGFQGQVARHQAKFQRYVGLTVQSGSYVHQNQNQIIIDSLQVPDWDYLLMVEDDQILPENWLRRVARYTEPIVGCLVYGRSQVDMRSMCGRMVNNRFQRLDDEELEHLRDHPGLHRVDVVGMGATAIRRDILVNWREDLMPWYQMRDFWIPEGKTLDAVGHDVWFCNAAMEQGHEVYVDSACVAGHIGTWISNDRTFWANKQWEAWNMEYRNGLPAEVLEVAGAQMKPVLLEQPT